MPSIPLVTSTIIAILGMSPVLSIAAFGQLLSQKSGDYNLGIEGIMASGAVISILGMSMGLNSWTGLLLGFITGAIFGLLLFILCDLYKLNQIVIGFGLWFLGIGIAGSIYTALLAPKEITVKPIGEVFLGLDPIFYISIAMLFGFIFIFSRTRQGLAIIAVGENPEVADSAGINVDLTKGVCNIIGGGLMGLAGAYLGIDVMQGFTYSMIAGWGWIAFAIVIFGRWKPLPIFLGAILFTSITAIATRLNILGITFLPLNYVSVLPHIGVLVVLSITMMLAKQMGAPRSLGQPYEK